MVKISLRLDKRYKLSNGKYAVKIAVARNGKTLYIPLNLALKEEDWTDKNQNHVKNLPQRQSINAFINGQLSRVELKLQELQLNGLLRNYSNKQLIEYLSFDNREERYLFKTYADEFIKSKKNNGTKEVYRNVLKQLQSFTDYDTLNLEEINKAWVENLIKYLKDTGKAQWTINTCVNKIKAIYHYALDKEVIQKPFPKISLRIPETRKRSLTIEKLRKLYNTSFPSVQQKYVDIFFLMLFMRGINMRDLSLLKTDAVKQDRIIYQRQKTGRWYDIKVEPEIQEIIKRYKGKEYLLNFFDGKDREMYYRRFGLLLSHGLRNAAKSINIDDPISAYYSRHSWASLAIELGASMEMVSAGLGHEIGAQVTQIYVTFQQKQIDNLARQVIDFVTHK